MTLSFHARSIVWIALSSTLLGVGIYTAVTGQQALKFAQTQQELVTQKRAALNGNQRRAETYQGLIERIGWRPGQSLRHETIDTSATIAGHESNRLNEILHANHVGRGQFFLRSLTIEAVDMRRSDDVALRVSVKGDNILVLDRP